MQKYTESGILKWIVCMALSGLTLCSLLITGCLSRNTSVAYPVRDGEIRIAQIEDEVFVRFIPESGKRIESEIESRPYTNINEGDYLVVDHDEYIIVLSSNSILNQLPNKYDSDILFACAVLRQNLLCAISRTNHKVVSLDPAQCLQIVQYERVTHLLLNSVSRVDIHVPVTREVILGLSFFPFLKAIVVGNQKLSATALDEARLPSTVRLLNLAHCRQEVDWRSLTTFVGESSVETLLLNKAQLDPFNNFRNPEIPLRVDVISLD